MARKKVFLYCPHFSSSYSSSYLVYIFFQSLQYIMEQVIPNTPFLTLRTINYSRELLLSHLIDKQTKSQKFDHLNPTAHRAGAVAGFGDIGLHASRPLHSFSSLHTPYSLIHHQDILRHHFSITSPVGAWNESSYRAGNISDISFILS